MATVPPPSSLVKLTVHVVRDLYDKFRAVAARRGITETEALQQALAIYTFIDETLQNGEKFCIADRQGQLREVFFDHIGQEAPPSRARTITELLKEFQGSHRWKT